LCGDLAFGQPSAEVGNQTDLQFNRLLGIALCTHLGSVGIEIRTKGAVLFAKLVVPEDLVHQCSPSRPACQENTSGGLCRENLRQTAACLPKSQFARNSPEPGIVTELVERHLGHACARGNTLQPPQQVRL
jgi:hypothetical protein